MRKTKTFNKRGQNKVFYRKNEGIRIQKVRLVGDNVSEGIYDTSKALEIARGMELDLVEVVPHAKPPVCKAVLFEKFLYEMKKKEKDANKKRRESKVEVKEIRFTPTTDEHDFGFKLRHAKGFLEKGNKVKACVLFKGRAIAFKSKGYELMEKFKNELSEYGKVISPAKMEGKRLIMILDSVKKKK